MAVTLVFYQAFKETAVEGMNLGSDTFKVMLTDAAPNVATHAVKADVTQIAGANGYTADGNACTVASSAQTGGTYKLVLNSPTAWTAGPGAMGQFRYAVLYDVTTGGLIGYYDYGSEVNLNSGDTFTLTLDGTNGVLTLT